MMIPRNGWFENAPIRSKLRRMIMVTCGCSLVLAFAAMASYEIVRYRGALGRELSSLADVVGSTSTAALEFDDAEAAREILQALHSDPRVTWAMLTRTDGTMLAHYRRPNSATPQTAGAPTEVDPLSVRAIRTARSVMFAGRTVGTITVEGELSDIQTRFTRYFFIMGLVLAASMGVAYLLSRRLERIVSQPLKRLADSANRVSTEADYSIRVRRSSRDEIGVLIERFNEMLEQIEIRDQALNEGNDRLEARVQERTKDLEHAKAAAESANQAKSQFLANISHEFRTPLTGILGYAELLTGDSLSADQRRMVTTIASCGHALAGQVDEILDFSRIEAGKLVIEAVPFEPREIVKEAVSVLTPRAEAKGLVLQTQFDAGLSGTAISDPGRIRQVILNLLGNAIKFTREGRISLRALLVPSEDSNKSLLRIVVRDAGIGIPDDALPHLFDAFSQFDASSTRSHGGTGLGLTICQRIAEAMNGSISVESQVDVGSTFVFTIPVELQQTAQPAASTATTTSTTTSIDCDHRPRILVVDDNDINRKLIATMTTTLGYRPTVVSDGRQALEAIGHQRFEAVLMDCQMPGMDGYETTRRLRKLPGGRHVPVIALTAHAMRGDHKKCLEAGMDDYLTKPFRNSDLHTLLNRWLTGPTSRASSGEHRSARLDADGHTVVH